MNETAASMKPRGGNQEFAVKLAYGGDGKPGSLYTKKLSQNNFPISKVA